jgi:hypothetical protein
VSLGDKRLNSKCSESKVTLYSPFCCLFKGVCTMLHQIVQLLRRKCHLLRLILWTGFRCCRLNHGSLRFMVGWHNRARKTDDDWRTRIEAEQLRQTQDTWNAWYGVGNVQLPLLWASLSLMAWWMTVSIPYPFLSWVFCFVKHWGRCKI